MDIFALLDDADASFERPSSRLYTGFVREHRCSDPGELDAVCAAVQSDLEAGRHAVLLADYEWGAKLLRAGHAKLAADDGSSLRVLMFDTLQKLDAEATGAWLAQLEGRSAPAPAGALDLRAEVTRDAFEAAIARIHEAIRDGETYQVNYTYRLHGHAWGAPVALYRRLRARQRVSFGALMRLPMGSGDRVEWVLSRSPELFIRHEQGRLQARPMKGTAARMPAPEGDSETARMLHGDIKNRAENLMIVDLLRNDLGRIAQTGSVKVPELFRVEPYATVFQMTSTVEAMRRPDVDLAGLLRAVFPCGSITGAPKHRTMEWIAALERGPRGLYTGAIGWLDRGDERCPDLCLSVAIRTLTLGKEVNHPRSAFGAPPQGGAASGPAKPDPRRPLGNASDSCVDAGAQRHGITEVAGLRPLTLGIGGGIVHDSVAADEYEETHWKARFLTALDPGVELFETMRATREGIAHLGRHRGRLAASARTLGFAFDAPTFDELLHRTIADLLPTLREGQALRLRVALSFDGQLTLTQAPLAPLPEGPVRLLLADAPLPVRPLAGHKTTLRDSFDTGVKAAQASGAFDTLFFGEQGQLLEGGRSNVFLRLEGRWFTPPISDGVLPGVMRAVLLDDPAWNATERRLTRDDLSRAEAVMVSNALRGAVPALVMAPAHA